MRYKSPMTIKSLISGLSIQEMHQEEHLDSDAETEIDDNTIPYHQYLLDTEAQNVPTEVSADTSDKISMIAILTDLQTQLDGHAKVNQEKCLEVETLKNELSQCKQEIYRLDTQKVKLDLENKVRQEQALVIQRNKRNAELVQENDLLKSTLSGKEKSIAFLQSEKEKILSEKKELADSYLDEIVCLKTANKVARDMLQRFNMPTQTIPMLSKKPKKATDDLHKDILGTRNPGLGYMAKRAQPVLYDADTLLHPNHHPVSIWDSEEVLVHQVVSMKKMNEKPGHVRPANGFYEKLNALMFVPQQELSREQAYWLPANEIASQASNPDRPVTPFIHTRAPPSQVLANLQKVNAVFHQFEGNTLKFLRLEADISKTKQLISDLITFAFLETELLDGLKVENVSLKRRYDELSKANTHSRTAYTEKLSAFTAENTKLKAQGSKYIPPPKRANWVKPTPVPKKKQVTFSEPPRPSLKPTQKPVVHPNKQTNVCVPMSTGVKPTSGASKTVPKRAPRNHSSLPVKSANARKVEAHHRTLNKKNRVDSNLLVKHSVSVSKMNNVCGACNKSLVFANHTDCLVMCDGSVNVKPHQTKRFKRQPRKEWKPVKRIWKPISKPVANSKPQWKPTGRHFSLFEKHPLTRIMESTDQPIELPPSASSSPKITMVSRFADHKLSDRQAGSTNCSMVFGFWMLKTYDRTQAQPILSRPSEMRLEVAFRQQSCHIRNYERVIYSKFTDKPTYTTFSRNDMMSASQLLVQKPLQRRHGKSKKAFTSTKDRKTPILKFPYTTYGPSADQANKSNNGKAVCFGDSGYYTRFGFGSTVPMGLAVATACYTLNRSLVHTLHGKTYYELLKGKKPNLQYFRVFGSLCYPTNDYDDIGKLKAKADIGIFVGYAPTKKAYRIYNKRTRKIQETVHVAFDELTEG
ncbi:gag-pol polyprotein [Tanacetum coccineum]